MPKPLISNQPYPETDGICHDVCALKIISPAYSTSSGELNAVMQYIYHSLNFMHGGMKEHAETLESIAIAEMIHFKLLGATIFALGAQPVFTAQPPFAYNFYSTKFVSYSGTWQNMIEDDIIGEKRAINGYERMLRQLKNEIVKEIIARIIEDERLHLVALQKILCDISC